MKKIYVCKSKDCKWRVFGTLEEARKHQSSFGFGHFLRYIEVSAAKFDALIEKYQEELKKRNAASRARYLASEADREEQEKQDEGPEFG